MDITMLNDLITNLGFPIVCVGAMAWFIYQIFKKTMAQQEETVKHIQEQSAAREERLYMQIDKFSDSLNSFNTTLIRIDARLEAVEEHLNR